MKGFFLAVFMVACCTGAEETRWQGEDLVETVALPGAVQANFRDADYEQRLNAVLRESRDVWGERLMEQGGATYETIQDFLQPLLFSTGTKNTEYGMHNILFAHDGGALPYIVALADGSRFAADVYQSDNDLTLYIGGAQERFGSDLERLEGPTLGGGWYPILETAFTDVSGIRYEQQSFASVIDGVEGLVLFVRLTATGSAAADLPRLRVVQGAFASDRLRSSIPGEQDGSAVTFNLDAGQALYLAWSPSGPLPEGFVPGEEAHHEAREAWMRYWDAALARGVQFDVPEPLVMDCQRNLLIQNLMLRWRYSLGSVVYHNSFFQPESSDAMSLLALYGFTDEARSGLVELLPMTKGDGYYTNWERGEKLSHGAEYYLITRDNAFLETHTPAYVEILEELARQQNADPHGLLEKQRHCGDIPAVDYCTFHQAVCWQGMRNMALAWQLSGNSELAERYGSLARAFRESLLQAVEKSAQWLPDGSLFVPSILLEQNKEVYSPITETRIGSYWNLCMPYAFASGLWGSDSPELKGIVQFLHNHGATLLGLLRFNYYPIEIGKHHPEGLPGYWTTGYDNVYLPSYLRVLALRDEAERLILSFYGKLAHGQTRGTFVSGEGDTVGVFPGLDHRSFYGAVCSANNMAFLLPLRLMLVRESFNAETGLPEGLHLAHATPRAWLEPGNSIRVTNAPTMFGPVSYTLAAADDGQTLDVTLDLPDRNIPEQLRLKVRPPHPRQITGVYLQDAGPSGEGLPFDAETGIIVLDNLTGKARLRVLL